MAGSQQQQIIDTIFSMKRKILRPDDSSDSEEIEPLYGNKKQNLKRKVHYSRSGDLDAATNRQPYKKRIEHAGYQRYVLQRNPPRYDPDGDIVEVGDEDEEDDDLSTIEENPYADIQLEHLLAPLTSAADLPSHPSLSIAYTSNHLTNLTREAAAISRKENASLKLAKILFNKLQGDSSFAPDALAPMARESFHDFGHNGTNERSTNGYLEQAVKSAGDITAQEVSTSAEDVKMEDAGQSNGTQRREEPNGTSTAEAQNGTDPVTNGASHNPEADATQTNGDGAHSPGGGEDASDTASQQTAHRMTTRARAQAASTPSPPSSPSNVVHPVHPLFTFSVDALPDRDFGLPPDEAESTRLLLMAYVQKQEEVARLAAELYSGLLEGERKRQEVLKMAKAEAHVGEMSDGEDWYDREEWSLDHDLAKGKDEEDDDAVVTGKKSTRQRRKPDKEDR